MRDIMTRLKLTVNETKTRVCKLPEEKFDFLGYTFGRCYSPRTGRTYMGTVPSKKRVIRICEAISKMTGREQTLLDQEMVVAKLNRTMIREGNQQELALPRIPPQNSLHPARQRSPPQPPTAPSGMPSSGLACGNGGTSLLETPRKRCDPLSNPCASAPAFSAASGGVHPKVFAAAPACLILERMDELTYHRSSYNPVN
jgi:hypothetical protein